MLKRWIKQYINTNRQEILKVVSLILIGSIIGIGIYIFTGAEVKELATSSVKEVLEISKSESYIKTNIIANGVRTNLLLIVLIALLSITLFGKWIIYGLIVLKGLALSLYGIILFKVFGLWWGIIAVFILILVVNIIYIPALIYIVICFLEVHFNIFKIKTNSLPIVNIYKIIFVVIITFLLMFSSVIVEQIGSCAVLNIYKKIV